jgi:transcriptional regulator with XRE-family HTH domain
MTESFGRYLQRERRMRDVPLERIAEETKINLSLLEALEGDRHENLPSPAIVKGFLRAYAQVLGLSGDALVLRYESFLETVVPDHPGVAFARRKLPRKPIRLGPVGWLLFLIVALGVGLHLRSVERTGAPLKEEASPEPEAPEAVVYRKNYLRDLERSAPPGTPPWLAATSPDREGPPGDGLNLLLQAAAPAKLRVILDGGRVETIALLPGQAVIRYALRGAVIETESPGRVSVQVNGEPVSFGPLHPGPGRIVLRAGEGAVPDDPAPIPPPPSTPLPALSLTD